MRVSMFPALSMFLAFTVGAAAAGALRPKDSATPLTMPWPGGARADLTVPDSLWQIVLSKLDRSGRPLGFTSDEMANYGRDPLVLRTVRNLFRDVRGIDRFSGKTAEDLIAAAADPADMVLRAFSLTDVSAGRMLPMPDSTTWGAEWLPKDTTPAKALDAVLAQPMRRADREEWERLPVNAQRLAIRIILGAKEAIPWIREAIDDPIFTAHLGGAAAGSDTAAIMARYRFAMAPWVDARMDQSATLSRASIEALSRLDREYLDFGSVLFLTHLKRALAEFRAAEARGPGGSNAAAFRGCRFETACGPVRITGSGIDMIEEPAFLSLDLGGDDRYTGRHGVPLSLDHPIGLVVDLGGNDTYEGGSKPVALGCGLFGLGAIFDLAGNDRYRCAEAGLGAGYFGTGILADTEGDDVYVLDTHDGEGSAMAGVGLLIDLAGNDAYTCGFSGQGFGETLGAGLLVDVSGNDTYLARDDGNRSPLYLNQSVSMAQGVGEGRRADLGEGHSLAGGIGLLVDGAGDDSYHATAWSQGAGYWWSAGFLEDLGGNDTYRNGKYSLGAGAHFAIGCQVDLSGDDRYNFGNADAVNQYQGHARDGSIGISIDGDGDDAYLLRSHCAGSGDLNAIGFFWDRRGNDAYDIRYTLLGPPNGWTDTPPMGTATLYTPFRSFRDDVEAVGLFLDTGGRDIYRWESPDSAGAPESTKGPGASKPQDISKAREDSLLAIPRSERGNDSEWPSHRGGASRGYGMDREVFR